MKRKKIRNKNGRPHPQTIADLESKWRGPTMAVEDTWRYVAIAVAFGLLIAVALVAALATWRLSWPATTALLVALLWLLATCLMALGLGELGWELPSCLFCVLPPSCWPTKCCAHLAALAPVPPA